MKKILILLFTLSAIGVNCSKQGVPKHMELEENNKHLNFDEFKSKFVIGPLRDGSYIVENDISMKSESKIIEYYHKYYNNYTKLMVDNLFGSDNVWDSTQKKNLTYCISNNFGSNKNQVITAMNNATAAWELAADINSYIILYMILIVTIAIII